MSRLLLVLLLLMAPLQLVWSATAPYCGHETSVDGKKHLGHHEHRHQNKEAVTDSGEETGGGVGLVHPDCQTCHLTHGMALPMPDGVIADAPREPMPGLAGPKFESHVPRGPERPDRADLTAAVRFGRGVALVSRSH